MDTTKLSLFGLLFVIRSISFLMLYIIWSYLRNKALAMQTLRDEMIKELIISLIPLTLSSDLLYSDIGPMPKEFALFLTYARVALAQYFFMQVLIVTLVRYLIIFHGPYIDSIEDQIVVNFFRIVSIVWVFLTCLYIGFSQDLTKGPDFLALTGKLSENVDTSNSFFTLHFLLVLDIIVMIFVYVRIEIYKQMDQKYTFASYNLRTIRTVVGVAIICGLLLFFRINIAVFYANFNNSIERLLYHIIVHFLCLNILPVLMILNNEKIVIYAKSKFTCYCLSNTVSPI